MRYIKADAIPDQIKYFNADDFVNEEIAYHNAMRDNVAYKEPTGYSSYQTDIGLNGPDGPAEAPNHGMFISEADASGGIPVSSALGARDFAVAAAGAPAVGAGLGMATGKISNAINKELAMLKEAQAYRQSLEAKRFVDNAAKAAKLSQYLYGHPYATEFGKTAGNVAKNIAQSASPSLVDSYFRKMFPAMNNMIDDFRGTYINGGYGYMPNGKMQFIKDFGGDMAKAAGTYATKNIPHAVGKMAGATAPYATIAGIPMAAGYSGYNDYLDWENGNRQAVVDRVMSRPKD